MKYNKKIDKYNDLIDKANNRENNNEYWGIIAGSASFACALILYDWKLALILFLFALWIKLGNRKSKKR